MYIVYTVAPRLREASIRLVRRYGCEPEWLETVAVGTTSYWGVREHVEVWQAEFTDYQRGFAEALKAASDDLGNFSRAILWIDAILETDCPEIQSMLDYKDPEHPSISWCARVFKERYAHWADPLKAMGACGVASDDFVAFCKAKGVTREGRAFQEMLGSKYSEWAECHVVAEFTTPRGRRLGRSLVVDWTARQYSSSRGYPHVWSNTTGTSRAFKPLPTTTC